MEQQSSSARRQARGERRGVRPLSCSKVAVLGAVAVLALPVPYVAAQTAALPARTSPITAEPAPRDASAAGQKEFVDGLIAFTEAVAGTFGDERAQVIAALERMKAGLAKWDKAIATYQSEVSARANDPVEAVFERHLALASMYLARGQQAAALGELDAAGRLAPRRAEPYRLRALLLDAAGRSSEALDAFRAAWELNPDDPIRAYRVLQFSVQDARADDARRAYEVLSSAYRALLDGKPRGKSSPFVRVGLFQDDAAALTSPPYAAYVEGYALVARGEHDKALAQLRQAAATDPLMTDPASGSAPMLRGIAALKAGRFDEARTHLESALEMTPASSEAHRILALTYWAAGQDAPCIEHLQTAVRANARDERSRLMLARVLAQSGRSSDAERTLRDAIDVLPGSVVTHWWLATLYEESQRIPEARRELQVAAPSVLAGRARLYSSIGNFSRIEGDFAGAADAFARRVRLNPNDPAAHQQLARAYLEQDRVDAAFGELVMALLIDPQNADAYAAIGQLHLHAGRPADAVAALRRATELGPSHGETRYALATALMQSGQTSEAERELEMFARASQAAAEQRRRGMALDVLKEEATLRDAEGAHDRAVALWQQVIAQEPASANHQALAAALLRANRVEDAIVQLETAASLGAAPAIYQQLAVLYKRVGRTEDSVRASARYERSQQQSGSRSSAK